MPGPRGPLAVFDQFYPFFRTKGIDWDAGEVVTVA